jgi:hypothetical protein
MNTKNIISIFKDYLDADSHEAILINGGWGSGKTFFWKKQLEPIAKEKKINTIYISLNGLSKIDTLEYNLFIKLLPFLGEKENKILGSITRFGTNVINQVSKHFLKASLTDLLKGISLETFPFKNYIICFDDLERCQIASKEVLGFINTYVEHSHLKVIILANEDEINISSQDYNRIKEKLVGRILNFAWELDEIIPIIFQQYKSKHDAFYNFLQLNESYIVSILKEYKQQNLRIISFYLNILKRLHPFFENIDKKRSKEILLFSAIICIEFKIGNLVSSDYNKFKLLDEVNKTYQSLLLMKSLNKDVDKDLPKQYYEVFYETYLKNRAKEYAFYSSIYKYILSGDFNSINIGNEIKATEPGISQEIQDYRTLFSYRFRELPNDEFKTLTTNVLEHAKNGKYALYDYAQFANFFFFFSEKKLVDISREEITKIIDIGLEQAKERAYIQDDTLQNLLHFQSNSDVTEIKNKIEKIHLGIKTELHKEKGREFIKLISQDDEHALAAFFNENKILNSFFQYIDSISLLNAITSTSNKQIFNFSELIEERYRITNIGEYLFEDCAPLTVLQNGINEFTNNMNDKEQPRKFLLETLDLSISKVCTHLNNTRKMTPQ